MVCVDLVYFLLHGHYMYDSVQNVCEGGDVPFFKETSDGLLPHAAVGNL